MSNAARRELFALVETFFVDYLPRQRGASRHTVRAYRDALKLFFEFAARRNGRQLAALELTDLDADTVAEFLDHIETKRSNSVATRNCRRAALRSFFRHLVRNDLTHSLQYTRVLRSRRKRLGSGLQLTWKPTTCVLSLPNPTGVPPTGGATTR